MLWGGHQGELELRRAGDGAQVLAGRFPYGKLAVLSDGGREGRPRKEVIAPGAFEHRLADPEEDIHLLVGHDFGLPLASKATRSLTFRDTPQALLFEARISPAVAATQHGRDVLALIGAGLAVGISPGFRIPPRRAVEKAEEITEEPDEPARGMHGALIRTIFAALLYELSIVTRPAYSDAQVQARSWSPEPPAPAAPPRPHLRHPFTRWRP